MRNRNKKIITFTSLILFTAGLFILLSFLSPEEMIKTIGVRNGYLVAGFISLFGGFSAGGSILFISTIFIFVAGGLNPVYLGLISGVSFAVGDMVIFFISSEGRDLIRGKLNKKIDKFAEIFKKRRWLRNTTFIITYLYIAFVPFPNDILLVFLAAIKYPKKKINTIIILGDITFALMISLLAAKGITFLR